MKSKFYLFTVCFFMCFGIAKSQNNTASGLSKKIIGNWQLLSVKKEKETIDYSNRNIEWNFDGKQFSVMSDDLKGRIKGRYYFRKSIFRTEPTYILKCSELTKTHLPHGKLLVKSVDKNNLIFTDWDDNVTYVLKRMKNANQ